MLFVFLSLFVKLNNRITVLNEKQNVFSSAICQLLIYISLFYSLFLLHFSFVFQRNWKVPIISGWFAWKYFFLFSPNKNKILFSDTPFFFSGNEPCPFCKCMICKLTKFDGILISIKWTESFCFLSFFLYKTKTTLTWSKKKKRNAVHSVKQQHLTNIFVFEKGNKTLTK